MQTDEPMKRTERSSLDRSPRRRARRAVGCLGVAVAMGFAAEGVARLAGLGSSPEAAGQGKITRPARDPRLPWENRRNAVRVDEFHLTRGGAPVRVVQRTNRFGFRAGREYARSKPPGVSRIVCLGDSMTFGAGVNDGETWPAVLQRRLDEEGLACEVLNLAVPGYDTPEETVVLETEGLAFAPDVVLLCFYVNDATLPVQTPAEAGGVRGWAMRGFAPRKGSWLGRVRACSVVVDALAHRAFATASYWGIRERMLAPYAEDLAPWREAKAALLRARELAENAGCAFAVILYPYLVERGGELDSHGAYEVVRAFCAESEIACLDLEEAFLGRDVRSLWVHPRNSHANAAGHELAGEAVARWVIERFGEKL